MRNQFSFNSGKSIPLDVFSDVFKDEKLGPGVRIVKLKDEMNEIPDSSLNPEEMYMLNEEMSRIPEEDTVSSTEELMSLFVEDDDDKYFDGPKLGKITKPFGRR